MKIKRLLSIVCVLGLATGSAVAATDYLHIRTSAGWEVLDVDDLKSLDFNAGTVTVTDKAGKAATTFSQGALELIYVDDSAESVDKTGVAAVADENGESRFTFDAANRTVAFTADGEFELYGVDGSRLVRIPAVKAGETVSLSRVTPGVVILKSGDQTLKTILK